MIDLRSDTVTKPDEGMMRAMTTAELGDDVHRDDPTVKKLEGTVAEYFGKEASLFCPSGTMTNQIGIFLHGGPGKELIVEKTSHVYVNECGGIASHARSSVHLLEGDRGRISAEQVQGAVNPADIHMPRSSAVVLENTANIGGGSCYDFEEVQKIRRVCDHHRMALHLDGARLWNALVAKKQSGAEFAAPFDSISVCLSKGLGAPVGSLLIGDRDFIEEARFVRKSFGGGMRQAGLLAGAGLYAFEKNFARMEEDHANAKLMEREICELPWVDRVLPVETNIVIFETTKDVFARDIARKLKDADILCEAMGEHRIRFVTHLQVSREDIERVCQELKQLS